MRVWPCTGGISACCCRWAWWPCGCRWRRTSTCRWGAAVFVPVLAQGGGVVAVLFGAALGAAALWFVVFVACGYGLTTQVVVLEDLGSSFDAFGRSWTLTRGFKLKVFAVAVVAFIIFW